MVNWTRSLPEDRAPVLTAERLFPRRAQRLQLAEPGHLFRYILAYRWLSLLPPLLALAPGFSPGGGLLGWVFAMAAGYNVLVTLFHPWLNALVVRYPPLLGVDVVFCAGLIGLSGGVATPYYLYALSPLFAAGLFLRVRGGLLAAAGMSASYGAVVLAGVLAAGRQLDVALMSIHVAGFFLIAGLFASFASLLEDQRANAALLDQIRGELVRKTAALQRSNRDLRFLHGLAVALQSSAVDVHDVQRRVLTSLTEELGYPVAVMGLLDHRDFSLRSWMTASRERGLEDHLPSTLNVPVKTARGPLAQAVVRGDVQVVEGGPALSEDPVLSRYTQERWVVLPLVVRELAMGVLAVGVDGGEPPAQERMALLASVAHQAALAIWSTRMCVERTQHSAVQEERNRIARDIHDTVLQCLFGTVYTLESCLRLIPEEYRVVRERLESVLRVSSKTIGQIRGLIFDMWVGGMTTNEFVSELKSYLEDLGAPETLEAEVKVEGDLTELTPFTRKHLFRIAQEALANVVRHAQATKVRVQLTSDGQAVLLVVQDNGVGFEVERTSPGMGLSGIRERALAIGGTLTVHSVPGQGTRVEVRVPRLACISTPQFVS